MNFYSLLTSIALTLSFSLASFASDIHLTKKDFSQAKSSEQSIVLAKLSPSGKKKFAEAKKGSDKSVRISIAGEETVLKLKANVSDQIQFGPFSKSSAQKIVNKINQ